MRKNKSLEAILKGYNNAEVRKSILRKYLRKMTDQQIIDAVGMAGMPKIIWLLETKHRCKVQAISIENDVMLRVANTNVANMSYLAVYLHFLAFQHNILQLEGNISIPSSIEQNKFYVKVNGTKIIPEFKNCGLDFKIGNEIYEKRTIFKIEILLVESKYTIEFFNEVNGVECSCSRINAMRFFPVNDEIKGQYCNLEQWVIKIEKNTIKCDKCSKMEVMLYEDRYQGELKEINCHNADTAIRLRQTYFEKLKDKNKPIWMIMDRPNRADDNGEVFFKYMRQHSEIATYFVIDKKCEDYQRLCKYGNVVDLYSEEHYLLVLMADCIISSQCNGLVENPFWDDAEYYRDLYHRAKIVFLQHGVIKDDMSSSLNRFHTNIAGFITSTYAEYLSILKYPYWYDKKNVWLTGLPIFDELCDNREKIIVFAPTWRMELMQQKWNSEKKEMQWVPNIEIDSSEYYGIYRSVLTDCKLQKYCKKFGYRLAIKPHPLMEEYMLNIVEGTNAVLLGAEVSYRDVINMGDLLVTDYSSIAFEFAYLKKSTIYFQFDRKSFFASHTYRKGYFDYVRDGFGEVCLSKKDLISVLITYMKNGCAVKEKYQNRIRSLYSSHGDPCKKIYEKIIDVVM